MSQKPVSMDKVQHIQRLHSEGVPIKEIAKLLIEEYDNVLNVLSGKGDVGQPKA